MTDPIEIHIDQCEVVKYNGNCIYQPFNVNKYVVEVSVFSDNNKLVGI